MDTGTIRNQPGRVTWRNRLAAAALGLVGLVVALLEAGRAGDTTAFLVFVAVVLGAVTAVVLLLWVRRKVRAGWRPEAPSLGVAGATVLGGSSGLLAAWFAPPEVGAPVIAFVSGVFLAASVSPAIPDPRDAAGRRPER